MAEEIKKVISIETKGDRSIKGLKNQIKDLKNELERLEIGTDAYEQALQKLTQSQKQYNEINADIRSRSATQRQELFRLAEFSEGLGKSFTALTGVIGMLGSENEDLNKILGKVAYSIQIISGLEGFTKIAKQLPNIKAQFSDWLKNLGLIKDRINDIAKTDLSKIKAGGADAGSGGGSGSDGTVKQNDVKAIRDYNKEVGKQNAFFGQNRSERRALQAQLQTELKLKKDLGKAIDQEIVALKKQKQAHSQTTKAISEAQRIYEKFQTGQRISSLEMEQLTSISQKYGKSTFELADALEQSGKKYTQAQESLKRLGNRYTKTADEVKNLETQIAALNKTQSAIVGFGKSVASTVGWTLLITAILTALGALWKWISNLKTAAKQQREFNKAIKEGTAQIASQGVVVLQELAYAYKKVGDNAEEKKKFIEQFKDKIAETGIAVNDVNTADNVFIKNTDKYVEALMARAKAQAIENKAIELYQEYLTKRAEIESKKGYEDDKKLANDLVKAGIMTQEEADMVGGKTQKKLNKLESEINGTLKRLFEDVANINSEWADFWGQMSKVPEKTTTDVKDNSKEELTTLEGFYNEALKVQMSAMDRELAELADKYKERLELAKKYGQDETQIREAWKIEQQKIFDQYEQEALDKEKAAAEERWQNFQQDLERLRREGETSKIQQPREQTFQTNYTKKSSAVFGLLGNFGDDKELFSYQSKEDLQKQYDAQIEYNNQIYEITKSRIDQENALLNEQLQNTQLTADQRLEIERTLAENEMALSDAKLNNEEANLNAYIKIQNSRQQALQSTMSVASNIAGSMATILGEESKAGKAFAVTQAIIDTYASANAAYKSMAGIPIVGPGLAVAAAAAAVAAGVANVKQILSTQVGSSVSGSVAASVPAPAALNIAPIEYTRNLLGDKETEKFNNPIKCYVLESDISNAQSKVQVTESNASF